MLRSNAKSKAYSFLKDVVPKEAHVVLRVRMLPKEEPEETRLRKDATPQSKWGGPVRSHDKGERPDPPHASVRGTRGRSDPPEKDKEDE